MSTLSEFENVTCPYDEVVDRLLARFGGGTAVVPLRLQIGDLRIERDAVISMAPKPGYPGYHLLYVSWTPEGGGPYPTFEGTLSVADEGFGRSRLDLYGSYKPPLGIVGATFDAAFGARIAHAVATELLAHFKTILSEPLTHPA